MHRPGKYRNSVPSTRRRALARPLKRQLGGRIGKRRPAR
jgi:hypothetical protein